MKRKRPDKDKIAKGLGAERMGEVSASGGEFGARQLLADVEERLRVRAGPSRDPSSSARGEAE